MDTQEITPYFILGCSDAGQIVVLDPACYGYIEKNIQVNI